MSEEPKPTEISGEHPIILPTPVAVVHAPENKILTLTRLFSWLTGLTLSISVLVALVNVVNERDNLTVQLSCRAEAGVAVNRAIINEQIALADHSELVGEFITLVITVPVDDTTRADQFKALSDEIVKVDQRLSDIGDDLRVAVETQQTAVTAC